MYSDILFPIDESEGASLAFEHVLDIASAHEATIHLLHVADTTEVSVTRIGDTVVDTLERKGEEIVNEAADLAAERGLTTDTEVIQAEPYSAILKFAHSRDVDLIAMPTHGRQGLERFLLGSTTERVLRRSNIPVLTIRWDSDVTINYPYQSVLVPTDGSDSANRALQEGVTMAKFEESSLHLLTVVEQSSLGIEPPTSDENSAERERATKVIDSAKAFATNNEVDAVSGTVEQGRSIHQAILSYIDEHEVDLVVVGTQGRTGFDRYILGSVTEYLVRTSPIPVLCVRESPD